MGNYRDVTYDFIERTLRLISQYEKVLHDYDFEDQYNFTLLLNCLLGIIVMPRDKAITHIPNPRITEELKMEMGIPNTVINKNITHLRDLIGKFRNSVAHFDIEIPPNEENLIKRIIFLDTQAQGKTDFIINFSAEELLPFVRYYGTWLLKNLADNRVDSSRRIQVYKGAEEFYRAN